MNGEVNLQTILDKIGQITPYTLPRLIWALIEEYFTGKWKVDVSDNYPTQTVDKPTIVWEITRRVPDGGKNGIATATGPVFSRYIGVSSDGKILEEYEQIFKIIYSWSVFAPNSEIAEDVAWELELAINQIRGLLEEAVEGLTMAFDEQIKDGTLAFRQTDEIVYRSIRYKVMLPVRFTKSVKQLRILKETFGAGPIAKNTGAITRMDTSPTYYIPVPQNQKVTGIIGVRLEPTKILLQNKVDYIVRSDSSNTFYIEWNDKRGNVPQVNQEFSIDYKVIEILKKT